MYHTPVLLLTSLQTNREARGRSTRQDDDLRLPPVRTEAGRRRFLCRGPMLDNDLPLEMRARTVASFNHALKRVIAKRDE